jgi:hypothetical protein
MTLPSTMIFNLIELMGALVGGTSAVKGFVDTIVALKHKERAKRYLRTKRDGRLIYLAKLASKRALKRDELDIARVRIRQILKEMPAEQASVIEKGISQPSASGTRRFIEEIIHTGESPGRT